MRRLIITFTVFLFAWSHYGQTEDAWVYFTGKPDADYYLSNPLEMLTQRALDRRAAQGIPLDETDVPVSQDYIDEVENAPGITVRARSKWMNCVHVQGNVSNIQALLDLEIVDHIEYANPYVFSRQPRPVVQRTIDKWVHDKSPEDFEYGTAYNQVHMLNTDYLHNMGYTGEGMVIAILDGGFEQVNEYAAFDRLFDNGQILGTHNYVNGTGNVYSGTSSHHGTMVLSTIAGYIEGQFAGTAPDADFYLFVTEDVTAEYILEESFWVQAAEEADRLGVDVINTSLGYSWFDNPNHDHSYEDMDGHTTFISRGAEMLSSKGVILCNSAGNSGNSSWHYITAPADADGILTVGAVDGNEEITGFSSYGPTYDGRIKPDVCAQGSFSAVIGYDGYPSTASGTSFSSPIMAGSVACFWQAFPTRTNLQIIQAVRESADRYDNPDEHYGYGIPDFMEAYNTLLGTTGFTLSGGIEVYPNPIDGGGEIHWSFPGGEVRGLRIADIRGNILYEEKLQDGRKTVLPELSPGLYLLDFSIEGGTHLHVKLICK